MTDQQSHTRQNELKDFINSEDIQKKIIKLLKEYDALRFRRKIQSEIDKLFLGEFSRWALSMRIHYSTGLPIKKTDTIMFALLDTILKPKLDLIQQAFNQSFNKEAKKIPKEDIKEPDVPIEGSENTYTKKPLNLKDIFEETENGNEADAITIPGEIEEETAKPKILKQEKVMPQVIHEQRESIKESAKKREDKAIDSMIGEVTVSMSDKQKKRLRDVMRSRLKNIRDAVDTRLALSRSDVSGGVGLFDSDASDVSLIIEHYVRDEWKEKEKEVMNEGRKVTEIDTEEEKVILKEPKAQVPVQIVQDTALGNDIVPDSIPGIKREEEKESAPVKKEKVKEVETVIEQTSRVAPVNIPTHAPKTEPTPPLEESHKAPIKKEERVEGDYLQQIPQIDNTKSKMPLHLVGPIEELQEMTIEEWRKLYKNMNEAQTKIKEKIDRLGKDSFSKKLNGIRAWQNGEIMKLYLLIGKASIEKHMGIDAVAEKLKADNKQYLTDQEFHAIMDLNKELRMY